MQEGRWRRGRGGQDVVVVLLFHRVVLLFLAWWEGEGEEGVSN